MTAQKLQQLNQPELQQLQLFNDRLIHQMQQMQHDVQSVKRQVEYTNTRVGDQHRKQQELFDNMLSSQQKRASLVRKSSCLFICPSSENYYELNYHFSC
jgi:hypothetical protein